MMSSQLRSYMKKLIYKAEQKTWIGRQTGREITVRQAIRETAVRQTDEQNIYYS